MENTDGKHVARISARRTRLSRFPHEDSQFSSKTRYASSVTFAQGRLPIRGLFLGARGGRALPERPAAQGAATDLCLFQSAVRISPVVCVVGSIAHFRC